MRLIPPLAIDRLDRYALRQMTGPLALSLLALLAAMLLERLLRLIDLAASVGAAFTSALDVASNLVPHYLGLALPLAFTAAMFTAVGRMSDNSELDVMFSAGRSMARLAKPFFILGVFFGAFNLYLFGQLQPFTRYYYHVAVEQMLSASWDSHLEQNRFMDAGRGFTFTADTVDPAARSFEGVFIERRQQGIEEITTAVHGHLVESPHARGPLLRLEDGQSVRERGDGTLSVTRFETAELHDIVPAMSPLKPRGDAIRERTLRELWADMHRPTSTDAGMASGAGPSDPLAPVDVASSVSDELPPASPAEAAAEFHGRLTRALLPPILPLLALPLGMASKRGQRAPGVIFAGLALLSLNHVLQFGQSLAGRGVWPAAVALWTPYAVFALGSLWIFISSFAWPGDNAVTRATASLGRLLSRLRFRRKPEAR